VSKRIVSGVTGAIFALMVLFFNQNCLILLNIITAIIAVLAMWEVFSVMNITKLFMITVPTLIFVPVLPLFGFAMVWQTAWYVYTLWMFSAMVIKPSVELKSVTVTYTMAILISFSLGQIIELRDFGGEYGSFFVLLALAVAWMSDTGAYFCGKFFGKNKLCPEVSPKKTIEGFIGGIITCILSMIFIAYVFNNFIFPQRHQINYALIIILGLIGSPISSLGDLCFSVIKRKCGVKDFGTLMPGHGGILDRFDSVIFVAPYVYLFLQLIPIIF
jgi:phosphatidate cytidylyltransferase